MYSLGWSVRTRTSVWSVFTSWRGIIHHFYSFCRWFREKKSIFRLHRSFQNLHKQIHQFSFGCWFAMTVALRITTIVTFCLVQVLLNPCLKLFVSKGTNQHVLLARPLLNFFFFLNYHSVFLSFRKCSFPGRKQKQFCNIYVMYHIRKGDQWIQVNICKVYIDSI